VSEIEHLNLVQKFKLVFDKKRRKITVRPSGRRKAPKSSVTLEYDSYDYVVVKNELQAFLDETDLAKKMAHLADALNIGSESTELDEIVFLLQILWHYPWNKEA
jgi:hypothetical protein